MRVAIAGIMHESLTFSPVKSCAEDFRTWRGEEVLAYPGMARAVRAAGIQPVPILLAEGTPSGWVDEASYLALRDEIVRGIAAAGALDGVCLLAHGSMLVENLFSGETDLVRMVRAQVGRGVPIAVRLDLHANLTEEFANKADIWTGFRTAPHRDMEETLERTMRLLSRCITERIRPRPVFVRIPLLLQGDKATTARDPMKTLLGMAREVEQAAGILSADVLVGFGWADAPHAGSNVVVIAEDDAHVPHAREAARRLARAFWERRHDFDFDTEVIASVDEAIDAAATAAEATVFITDSGDNVTSGTAGDGPYVLSRLLARRVPDAVFAAIPDRQAVDTCFAKGVGAAVGLTLGARLDPRYGAPVSVTGTIEHLAAPTAREVALATVRAGGVHIILSAARKEFTTVEDFRRAGVEPLEHKIVVVKLGYLWPGLRDIAPREIITFSPGSADMDLARLPYRYVTRPVFPLDNDFAWQPVVSNVAGYEP